MTRSRATAIGFTAVLLWALLALFTVGSAPVPPLQLNAMCFAVGGTLGLIWAARTGQLAALRRIPPAAFLLGTIGLFGYHALYFAALSNAPPAQAGLIAYLWPLLIVLFSACLPSERLHGRHLIGVTLALFGCWLLLGGGNSDFDWNYLPGYLAALCCALIWALYSLSGRWISQVPTDTVGAICGLCALLGWGAHLLWEDGYWPGEIGQWLAVFGLGVGPLGLAFLAWDRGIKQGNLQLLGVLSYGAPLISTAVLILFTDIVADETVYLACTAIVLGALVAALGSALIPVSLRRSKSMADRKLLR